MLAFVIGQSPADDVGDEHGDPPAVAAGDAHLRAGVWPLAAGEHVHPIRPGPGSLPQMAGELGDPFAMYMAKGRGKNCVEVFAASMHLAMQMHSDFQWDLARAAGQDQLVLHHQPIFDLATGQVLGVEALVRWQHPTRGMVSAERLHRPGRGDRRHRRHRQVGTRTGVRGPRAVPTGAGTRRPLGECQRLAVAADRSGFVDVVLQVLSQHDLPSRSLILEITEHAAVTSTAVVNQVLEALRAHGVRIALDDFGVGFSSLRYLRELPVDLIKDRPLLRHR